MTSFPKLILFGFVLPLLGCTTGSEKKKGTVHDFYFDFQKEANALNTAGAKVFKLVSDNGKADSLTEAPNWEKELQLFLESDINYRPLSDQFTLNTGYLQDTLIKQLLRNNAEPGVQEIEHYFLSDTLVKVLAKVENRDLLRSSEYILTYFPQQAYAIQARVSIPFLLDRRIAVKGKIIL